MFCKLNLRTYQNPTASLAKSVISSSEHELGPHTASLLFANDPSNSGLTPYHKKVHVLKEFSDFQSLMSHIPVLFHHFFLQILKYLQTMLLCMIARNDQK